MSRKKASSEHTRLLFVPENSAIWLVAIVGLSLSFAALLLIQQQLEAHKILDFEWVAHNRIRALNHGLDNSLSAITTLRDHLVASGRVDGDGFRVFADSLLDRYRGVEVLMWVPRVEKSERDGFEASIARGRAGIQITEYHDHFERVPSAMHTEYFPVLHVVPEQQNQIPTGFDLGSIPGIAETLSRARDQGRMAASRRIAYPNPQGVVEYGFMVASPLFADSGAAQPSDEDSGDLTGFVVGFFRLGNLINAAISLLEPRGVEILMLDESAPPGKRFLHFYASRLSSRTIDDSSHELWHSDSEESKVAERVQVADRQLAIVCGRTHLFRSAEAFQDGPWMVLVAGLLFTVLPSIWQGSGKTSTNARPWRDSFWSARSCSAR
jgi:CHASE1-domain containing sensor protein